MNMGLNLLPLTNRNWKHMQIYSHYGWNNKQILVGQVVLMFLALFVHLYPKSWIYHQIPLLQEYHGQYWTVSVRLNLRPLSSGCLTWSCTKEDDWELTWPYYWKNISANSFSWFQITFCLCVLNKTKENKTK